MRAVCALKTSRGDNAPDWKRRNCTCAGMKQIASPAVLGAASNCSVTPCDLRRYSTPEETPLFYRCSARVRPKGGNTASIQHNPRLLHHVGPFGGFLAAILGEL